MSTPVRTVPPGTVPPGTVPPGTVPAGTVPTRPTDRRPGGAVDPGAQLLDGLEALVRRHRALAHDTAGALHAELITAEVAQQLAVARNALRRLPRTA